MTQHVVCEVDELPVGKMKAFTVAGEKLVVYHLEDGFFATQASCTHLFGRWRRARSWTGARCSVRCIARGSTSGPAR